MKKKIITTCVCFLLPGCVSAPTKEELANADYGECPIRYETIIKAKMEGILFDPESARYQFEPPQKSYAYVFENENSPFGKVVYGWQVKTLINAKNRLGGYTGFQLYTFLFRGDNLITWEFWPGR